MTNWIYLFVGLSIIMAIYIHFSINVDLDIMTYLINPANINTSQTALSELNPKLTNTYKGQIPILQPDNTIIQKSGSVLFNYNTKNIELTIDNQTTFYTYNSTFGEIYLHFILNGL